MNSQEIYASVRGRSCVVFVPLPRPETGSAATADTAVNGCQPMHAEINNTVTPRVVEKRPIGETNVKIFQSNLSEND
ncbi:MAG: hypothetical protein D6706_02145 [Chloroflexi bacterium]|nr:MAG: hypothetical protein D6706_02145 [Chloroflexota bacterium]